MRSMLMIFEDDRYLMHGFVTRLGYAFLLLAHMIHVMCMCEKS